MPLPLILGVRACITLIFVAFKEPSTGLWAKQMFTSCLLKTFSDTDIGRRPWSLEDDGIKKNNVLPAWPQCLRPLLDKWTLGLSQSENSFCFWVVELYQPSTSCKPQSGCSRDIVDRLIYWLIYMTYLSNDIGVLERVQRKITKMIKGLVNVLYRERL